MRRKIPLVVGLAAACAVAIPAQARAGGIGGIVVAKQHARGMLVVVRPNGVGLAVSGVLEAAKVGDRVALEGATPRNGLMRASGLRVSAHVRRALIRGVVVRRLPQSLLVATGRSVVRIRLGARAVSSVSDHRGPAAGTIGEFRVRFDDDDLVEEAPMVPVGQAAGVRIEGTVTSTSPLVVSVEGLPLTITVPAGMTLPAALAVGRRIEATVTPGTAANTFTLVSIDEIEAAAPQVQNAREVEAKGTVVTSTTTQIAISAGGATITFNAPSGTTLPILATGTFVEARGIMQNGVTTLTRLRTEDRDGDHGDGGGDGGH